MHDFLLSEQTSLLTYWLLLSPNASLTNWLLFPPVCKSDFLLNSCVPCRRESGEQIRIRLLCFLCFFFPPFGPTVFTRRQLQPRETQSVVHARKRRHTHTHLRLVSTSRTLACTYVFTLMANLSGSTRAHRKCYTVLWLRAARLRS